MIALFPLLLALKDPLFPKMEGHWEGQGTRVFVASGERLEVRAEVRTTEELVGGRPALVSRNRLTETTSDGKSRTYVADYWIRPDAGHARHYELGNLSAQQPSSRGELGADGVFRVEQDLSLGGESIVIHSSTQFEPQFRPRSARYEEVMTEGPETESKTEIEYQRIAP